MMVFYVADVFLLCCECYYAMLHWTNGASDEKIPIGRPGASKSEVALMVVAPSLIP